MLSDSGVGHIRLRGTNPQLASMLPALYSISSQSPSFGVFIDEALRYLAQYRLTLMSLEYNAGTREVTVMVRG